MRDTGIGIPSHKQEMIFDAFAQADASTTREFGGTGLGLTICARLTALMGGGISVTSQPGRGSEFLAHVCVQQASEEALTPAGQTSPHGCHDAGHVLLAEDNPVNQLIARKMLEHLGYRVTIARNGREAVDLAVTTSFDVVLMDVQMPEMNGLEAAQAIRRLEQTGVRRTPIVALTANAMQGDREQRRAAGMDAYLTKPVDMQALASTLREQLAAAR